MVNYKVFPQEKTKKLIIEMQELLAKKDSMSEAQYNRKYKNILQELYPILEFVAYTAINKKVQHLNSRIIYHSSIAEGMKSFTDDLVLYAIDQMLKYIPKIDTTQKVSNVLYVTAVKSSTIYLYSQLINTKHNEVSLDQFDANTEDMGWVEKMISVNAYLNYINNETNDTEESAEIEYKEEKIHEIYNKIIADFNNNKINYKLFVRFMIILDVLIYYLQSIATKHDDLFDAINMRYQQMHIKTHQSEKSIISIIRYAYKIYIKNINPNFRINIGLLTLNKFLNMYIT